MAVARNDAADTTPAHIDEVVFARAQELGLLEALLCRAHDDREWRAAVESSLRNKKQLGKLLRGGAKPSDIWRTSLLRRQVIASLTDDSPMFMEFALTNPRVADAYSRDAEATPDLLAELDVFDRPLAAFALPAAGDGTYERAVEEACDELERHRPECPEIADPPDAAPPSAGEGESGAAQEAIAQLRAELGAAKAAAAKAEKELKQAKADLRKRTDEVSRKDRKAQDLRSELKAAQQESAGAVAEAKTARAERDEFKREVGRLRALVDSSKTGQRTIEQRRLDESDRLQQAIADLRERLQATLEAQAALEARTTSLEAELDDERERRTSVEAIFETFGLGDLAGSARNLDSTLETLSRLLNGIVAYSAAQAEKEHERRLIQEEAERQRKEAEEARLRQAEMEQSWEVRERTRLEDRERALFPDGQIDCIIIDGHNLVHRVFRPEDEARTRPWLERMTLLMAERLERRGWDSRVHLVFDTQHNTNSRGAGHGLKVHFRNNVHEGGADAKIRELLEEGNPAARYMVISTDRKHVWSDALEVMESEGTEIDLVQVELLAQYLQTLDEFED